MNRFICLDSPDKNLKENMGYSNEFQAMLDGLEDDDSIDVINCSGKKRRLNIDQVQALERIFEVDNKLDPERKIKLAQELGLQPRQVAIWFQNRRARWKTKQLERDYHLLKANYEALQLNFSKVEQEKEGLVAELKGLKEKLGEENADTTKDSSAEKIASSNMNDSSNHQELGGRMYKNHHHHQEVYNNRCTNLSAKGMIDFKEGFSDSDSSGVLNNEDGNNLNLQPLMISKLISSYNPTTFNGTMDHSFAPVYHPHLLDSRDHHQQQFVKMDEQNHHFTVDESCNFFSLDQATPFWYCSDPRN